MSVTSNESLGFHARMSQLELRLKESEDERFKLEERFNKVLHSTKSEESKQLFRLRENYRQLLERDRLRCERNDLIIRTLNRIENRTTMLTAKTDRLRLLRHYYESYMDRHCSNWKRSDLKYPRSVNDLSEISPSTRPPSPSLSLFSSCPVPLFTSTPSTTRRSSLVVPDLDLESPKYKFTCETSNSYFPTRRKLFGDNIGLKNNEKKLNSNVYTENVEATPWTPNVKSKDFNQSCKPQLSSLTIDCEQSTNNDLLQMSLTDDDPNLLSKTLDSNYLKVETIKPKTNYSSNLCSPNSKYKQSNSIFGENKLAKTASKTSPKPLAKSCSFSATSSYLNRPDRYISTERRSNLIKIPTYACRSTISPRPTERALSPETRVSPSAVYNRSKSPLRVVDDIFKKYLINYDKRYLSDPISESKYGKYLYPSRSYELDENNICSGREEIPRHSFHSNYNDFKHFNNKKEFYPFSKESLNPNQYGLYRSNKPDSKSMSKSVCSGLDIDSPRSTYSNDWKDWDHYRSRYEYTTDDDMRSFQTVSSHVENSNYPKYVSSSTFEDTYNVPQIYIDSSNINHIDRIDPYYKPFDYQKSKYPASKTDHDESFSEKWFSDDNYASLGAETSNILGQSLKGKNNTKVPQTPKKVSFSNECLYDRYDLEADSPVDEIVSQDTENSISNYTQIEDFTKSYDTNSSLKSSTVHDHKNNQNIASFQNEIKDIVLESKTSLSNSAIEQSITNGDQCPISPRSKERESVESNLNLPTETDSYVNSKLVENQTVKESVAGITESGLYQNLTESTESPRSIEVPRLLNNKSKNDNKDDKSLNQLILNELQDSKLEMLQEMEVADTSKNCNEEIIQNKDLSFKDQSFKHNPTIKDDQENINFSNNKAPNDKISDLAYDDSIHQTHGDVDSKQVLKDYEENKTENSNVEGYQGIEQNNMYGDNNKNTPQDNDFVDQSYQDKLSYDDTNLSQYNLDHDQVHYNSSDPQYEQQVRTEYNDGNYTEPNLPEYDQVQGAYETETYAQESMPQSYEKVPEVYDNQYPEHAYEQPINYDTESYRQDYEQPVAEEYHPTDYPQEQYVKGDEEHFSPSHYQSEPGREYATEQYQDEYSEQPVQYDKEYQNPIEESKQQFEANYDKAYQKDPQYNYENPEPVFDPNVPPEQYDQYDQQPYAQYDQQSEQFDQYDQQQPYEQYDQQPKDCDGYEQPPQPYDQQPKAYDDYEDPPQQYDPPSKVYAEYDQPQTYDQQSKEYDGYVQEPQQYIPYEPEQQQQPHNQYDERDPVEYDQYEQQQKEQYGNQYQGEPDQFGNYDYNCDGQNVNTEQVYRGDEHLAYTDQPQNDDNNAQHPGTAQEPYETGGQLPYGEHMQASYEGPQQPYSESQVKYEDKTHSKENLNQKPRDVTQPLNITGKTVQESVYDSSAQQVYSETADLAAPNLSRVLESDSESARIQDPQEAQENSSDFDFSSGPK